jgi:hypothetical protein
MNLFIRTLTGQTLTIDVPSGSTIQDVKEQLVPLQDITSTDGMRLLLAGKQLDNDHTVSDYNIQNESTLNLVKVFR